MAQYINQVGYGLTSALPLLAPFPIKANRAPTSADKGFPIGQLWIYSASNAPYILTSIVNNLAVWELLLYSGGPVIPGAFTTLTSTGQFNLDTTAVGSNTLGNTTGATSLAISVGTGGLSLTGVASSNVTLGTGITTGAFSIADALTTGNISIGTAQTSGTLNLGSTAASTGIITLGGGTGAQTLNIAASGTGVKTINIGASGSQDVIAIGSTATGSSMTLSVGTGNFLLQGATASTMTIGTGLTTGTILVGGAAQSGAITVGSSTAAQNVNIGVGATGIKGVNIATGATNNNITVGGAGNNTILIGTSQTGGQINLGDSMTTGLISIGAATSGNVSMPAFPVTAAGTTVVNNARVGQAIYTGVTTASGAAEVLTLTNALISATSSIFITVSNLGGNDAQMSLRRVLPGAGTCAITLFNNGAAALNGNIQVSFWVN